jgi:hypothetical protein
MEVPQIAKQKEIGGIADAGQKCIHQRDALDLIGILRGVGVGHHQADVVADDANAIEAERGGKSVDILGHRFLVVAAGGLG